MANKTTVPSGKSIVTASYSDLTDHLKKNEIASMYVIWGEETYLIERSLLALQQSAIAPGCKDADSYQADWSSSGSDPELLQEMTRTPPFLSQKRLIIIKNSGLFGARSPETPEISRKYVELFSSIPDFCCLVFVEEKVDKRKKVLLDAAGSCGMLVQIDRQSVDILCKWVAKTLTKDNIRITTEAMNSLVDRTEGSMQVLGNEMQKIVLYCRNSKTTGITLQDIDQICIPDIRGSIFQMTDAIGARKVSRALDVLDTLISLKEPVPKIRFMLARHIRQLICAKELVQQDRIMTVLKVVPFVARNLSVQSRSFQMEELTALYESCASSDYSVKTGKIDDRMSMEILLVHAGKAAT